MLALPVNRGDVIGSGDIEVRQQRSITRDLVGYLSDEQDILGKEARKNLVVGSKLRKSDLSFPANYRSRTNRGARSSKCRSCGEHVLQGFIEWRCRGSVHGSRILALGDVLKDLFSATAQC